MPHSAGIVGSPCSQRTKTPIFMSCQPPVELTLAASVWNSTSSAALEKTSVAAGEFFRNATIRLDSASQARRSRSSLAF